MEDKHDDKQTISPTTIVTERDSQGVLDVSSQDKGGFHEDVKREINSLFKFGSEFAAFSYDILQDATASAVVAVSDTVDAVVETQNRMTLNSIVDSIVKQLDVKISEFNNKPAEGKTEERKFKSLDEVFNNWKDEAFQKYESDVDAHGISISEGQRNEHSQYSIRRRILDRAIEKKRESFVYKMNDDDNKNESFEIVTEDFLQLSVDMKAQLENLKKSLPMNKKTLLSEFDELLKSCNGGELQNTIVSKRQQFLRINDEKVLELLKETSRSYGYPSATFSLDMADDDIVLVH